MGVAKKHGRGEPKRKGTRALYTYENTRDVDEGHAIAKHGRLQGESSRSEKDRSLGSRGSVPNREETRGKQRRGP
jgi:hypothetical protein